MKKVIHYTNNAIDTFILIVSLIFLIIGGYSLWDSLKIESNSATATYNMYRPGKEQESFAMLKKLNPEVLGWLTIEGTHIDYPLVQGKDNAKYVNTDAKGEFSLSGSLFLDYRNQKNFLDANNIIYGHHMEKKSMFGELSSFADKSYFETHRYGKIYYDDIWHTIEFLVFLRADAYDEQIYDIHLSHTTCPEFVEQIKARSIQFRNVDITENEHFVTLSTCALTRNTNERDILIGRITDRPLE